MPGDVVLTANDRSHYLILLENGTLYTFGSNHCSERIDEPRKVDTPKNIVDVGVAMDSLLLSIIHIYLLGLQKYS